MISVYIGNKKHPYHNKTFINVYLCKQINNVCDETDVFFCDGIN